jgi:hypothetical protein
MSNANAKIAAFIKRAISKDVSRLQLTKSYAVVMPVNLPMVPVNALVSTDGHRLHIAGTDVPDSPEARLNVKPKGA